MKINNTRAKIIIIVYCDYAMASSMCYDCTMELYMAESVYSIHISGP